MSFGEDSAVFDQQPISMSHSLTQALQRHQPCRKAYSQLAHFTPSLLPQHATAQRAVLDPTVCQPILPTDVEGSRLSPVEIYQVRFLREGCCLTRKMLKISLPVQCKLKQLLQNTTVSVEGVLRIWNSILNLFNMHSSLVHHSSRTKPRPHLQSVTVTTIRLMLHVFGLREKNVCLCV